MHDFQERLYEHLKNTAKQLRELRLPEDMARQMDSLAGQVGQPCEVAVVGRVKAGKSTFINAFLGAGDELAKVGVNETTATINYFRDGQPSDPTRPVRCYWRGGRWEDVTREFLDALQGNDLKTLRLSDGIDHLEYRLRNKYLAQGVVLVDTPGIGAVVDDHQNRTAEYMHLYRQLRQRHEKETEELDSKADAVIYLTGAVAGGTDRAFLDDFGEVTKGRSNARNAIGVMARIDELPDILSRRRELAAKVAHQMEKRLNTVIPVSGGLEFALHRLGRAGLRRLAAAFSRVPPQTLESLLGNDELYKKKPCPLTLEEREALLDDKIPWTVFTTIARKVSVAGGNIEKVEEELADLAGFRPLKEVLKRHFFQRAAHLRCFRIVNEGLAILRNIRYHELPKLKVYDRQEQAQRERFVAFIREAGGERPVARELEEFVTRVCGVARRAERLGRELLQSEKGFGGLFQYLEEHNADDEALQLLDEHDGLFSAEELDELRALFGRFGLENEKRLRSNRFTLDHVGRRQQYWRQDAFEQRNPIRTQVAELASFRYGLILDEMDNRH